MQAGIHVFHHNEENALSVDHLHEVVLHLHDVGMIQLGNDAQLSIFVLWILDHFLDCISLMSSLVYHLCDIMNTRYTLPNVP